ncbi:hypothetical protein [Qipengyuania sediminis]|uniref:hypothetical protein n=1 Tax=Qipengyuania sediminis TaxID=1532023 RepID=UPI001980CA38|nr:hypothetical protein [Qipengyuania sediminis]
MTQTLALSALALLALGTAPPPAPLDQQNYRAPAKAWPDVEAAAREQACRDRIEHARAEAGRPKIERETADPDKPLMFHAVATRVDGCDVLVMTGDPSDIRQSPKAGPPRIMPAR